VSGSYQHLVPLPDTKCICILHMITIWGKWVISCGSTHFVAVLRRAHIIVVVLFDRSGSRSSVALGHIIIVVVLCDRSGSRPSVASGHRFIHR
jgi:hypothetical protein